MGGCVGAVLITLSFSFSFFSHRGTDQFWFWVPMAVVSAVAGVAGDLVESQIKRTLHIKDSGHFFGGHGGFLDRFDSLVFVIPVWWSLLRLFECPTTPF